MKGRLLAGAMTIAPPPANADPPSTRRPVNHGPVATIGIMKKDATADQRALHHRMKRDMKKAARNVRYQQLQDQQNAAKE